MNKIFHILAFTSLVGSSVLFPSLSEARQYKPIPNTLTIFDTASVPAYDDIYQNNQYQYGNGVRTMTIMVPSNFTTCNFFSYGDGYKSTNCY